MKKTFISCSIYCCHIHLDNDCLPLTKQIWVIKQFNPEISPNNYWTRAYFYENKFSKLDENIWHDDFIPVVLNICKEEFNNKKFDSNIFCNNFWTKNRIVYIRDGFIELRRKFILCAAGYLSKSNALPSYIWLPSDHEKYINKVFLMHHSFFSIPKQAFGFVSFLRWRVKGLSDWHTCLYSLNGICARFRSEPEVTFLPWNRS